MNILLFNLGSTVTRINSWGLEGFKSLFEQNVILWGPIPDQQFSYGDKDIPIIRIFEVTSIFSVFKRLPENWYPDIVVCDTSVISFIPDIYLCPVKTLLFARDSWADTIYNRGIVEFFDFVDYGIVDRTIYNTFNTNLLPLSNCAVSLPDSDDGLPRFDNRRIDIISIVNFNSGFYHDRYKTLYRLSQLNNGKFNLKYISGIKRKTINHYYQNSKIVLDWAHTLSNRSYEAALNRCLLFSHEDNPVLKTFWVPFAEYIPYNDNNLLELLSYYINNPEESEKVIKNAYEKVMSISYSMGQSSWEHIMISYQTETNIDERIKRNKDLPPAVLDHRQATPLVYNYNYRTKFPENWKEEYFKRIDKSLSAASGSEHSIMPLIESSRLAFLLNDIKLTEKYLSKLETVLPDYAWLWYIRARQQYALENLNSALENTERSIDCATRQPELIKKYILPLNEKHNSCDGRRITSYIWQPVHGHNNEFQIKSLFYLSYELRGDVFSQEGSISEAITAYEKAFSYIPGPRVAGKLCKLLVCRKDYKSVYSIADKGLQDSPYSSVLILYGAFALYMDTQRRSAGKLLKSHLNALKNFHGKRRLRMIRQSLRILLILRFLGEPFFSGSILYILRALENGDPE